MTSDAILYKQTYMHSSCIMRYAVLDKAHNSFVTKESYIGHCNLKLLL